MVKFVVALLIVVAAASARNLKPEGNSAYGYLTKYGIPAAERIRKAEEQYKTDTARITGGVPAAPGQYPFQAALLIDLVGVNGVGVCGGALLSNDKVVTAAHCWYDGINQAWRFNVVLGTAFLFQAGYEVATSTVATHPDWFPLLIRNDIAMVHLPYNIVLTPTIAPIDLPRGYIMNENFAGEDAIAVGFGATDDGVPISQNQQLHHVNMDVISNGICFITYPLYITDNNLCTSGLGGNGFCAGDSGGPLFVMRDGEEILIGIGSFHSDFGCSSGLPGVFTRVTSYMDFIDEHLTNE